jgi:hypothetical protein
MKTMKATTISPGDIVTLGHENGLGTGTFEVIKVYHGDPIHKLLVQGSNGHYWSARIEGAKIVRKAA